MDIDIFRYLVNQDPAWDWHSFSLEEDIDRALLRGKKRSTPSTRTWRNAKHDAANSSGITVGATAVPTALSPPGIPSLITSPS
jgi:hypothetical protein